MSPAAVPPLGRIIPFGRNGRRHCGSTVSIRSDAKHASERPVQMTLVAESRGGRDIRNGASGRFKEAARAFDTQCALKISDADTDVLTESAPEICRMHTCEGREFGKGAGRSPVLP